ncbi:MAG TPA: MerR family transcriptional regulator [Sphingomonadaceae bacterium]
MGGDPRFTDGKDAAALRTIGEVAAALGIKQHVLRYWEQQFPTLKPLKRSGGRRYYRSEDIRTVQTIDRLVNREGYTLKGARQAIEGGGAGAAIGHAVAQPAAGVQPGLIAHLRAIRQNLAAALE